MSTINLVMISLGEYSDREEIPLFATENRDMAEKAVIDLMRLRGKFEQELSTFKRFYRDDTGYPNWGRYTNMCKALSEEICERYSKHVDANESMNAWVVEVEVK